MTSNDWRSGHPVLGLFLNGEEIPYRNRRGQRIEDDSFLILVNAHHDDATFRLPVRRFGGCWEVEIATSAEVEEGARFDAHTEVEVQSRSMLVLRRVVD
jgi:glycogen operon protein